MHALLDYDGNLPAYANITDGKTADNKGAYDIPLLAGSVIVADQFYNDFSLLNIWDSNQVYIVIRYKENIQLTGVYSKRKHPNKLRRVAIWDENNEQVIELITNQMSWTANTISELY